MKKFWRKLYRIITFYIELRKVRKELKKKPELSSIYVDKKGCVMCGEPNRAGSRINGIRDINGGLYFINRMGGWCRGHLSCCKEEFRYK